MTIGILLINLGTPDAPTPHAVKRYLHEFLSDPYVIPLWKPLRWLLLNGLILPLRTSKTTKLYQKIWQPDGSPLLIYSKKQASALQKYLNNGKTTFHVVLGMRYGNPSIKKSLDELKKLNIKKIIILPLYPQYASATTGSTFDLIKKEFKKEDRNAEFYFINEFYKDPGYISALAKQIKTYWQRHGKGEKLLFSFHGLPASQDKEHLYENQCYKTAHLIAEKINLTTQEYQVVFQSRFGFQQWLTPYCSKTLKTLALASCARVDVICPGFVSDCLETREEIAIQNKTLFLNEGGKEFHYIPALNDNEDFIQALANIIKVTIKY